MDGEGDRGDFAKGNLGFKGLVFQEKVRADDMNGAEIDSDDAEIDIDGAEIDNDDAEINIDGGEIDNDDGEINIDGAKIDSDDGEINIDRAEININSAEINSVGGEIDIDFASSYLISEGTTKVISRSVVKTTVSGNKGASEPSEDRD